MTAGPPLIRLRGITKVYGEGNTAFQALKWVDLDIERGDFVAIMGPSGSGKSTALNLLGCLDRPSGGQYLFMGAHVEALSRDERARGHGVALGGGLAAVDQRQLHVFQRRGARQQVEALEHKAKVAPPQPRPLIAVQPLHGHAFE